jgi:predicted ABC-type exoprotein transport system permease subunit
MRGMPLYIEQWKEKAMVQEYRREGYEETRPVDRSTLSVFTLLLGWLGAHKFYVRHDMLGAIYFAVTVLGLVLTLYQPIWVTVFGFNINLAAFILLAPFVASIIEFSVIRKYSDGELHHRFHRTGERLTLVFVSQVVYLVLLVIPKIYWTFTE